MLNMEEVCDTHHLRNIFKLMWCHSSHTLSSHDRGKNIRKNRREATLRCFWKLPKSDGRVFIIISAREKKVFSVDNLALLFLCLTILTINDNDQLLAFMTPFHCCRHFTGMNEILKTPHNVVVNFRQIHTRLVNENQRRLLRILTRLSLFNMLLSPVHLALWAQSFADVS